MCFIIIIIHCVVVFEGGINIRVQSSGLPMRTAKPNDIESPVRFTDGRWHLKISVLIALFVIPEGICDGIDVRDIYILFSLAPGKQLVKAQRTYPIPCRSRISYKIIEVSRHRNDFECTDTP